MKKDLPFSLIILFTVFAGIFSNTAHQNSSFHYDVNAINCGHSHKFLDNLIIFEYKKGYDIIADQAGRAGIISERLDFEFTKFWGRNLTNYQTISVSQKTEG